MYSTKNIEKILLAELSRWQYNQWMSDSLEQTDTTLRDTVKVYKNAAFQQIFGKERRVFIPIEVDLTEEDKKSLQQATLSEIPEQLLKNIKNSYYIVYFIYFLLINNNINSPYDITGNVLDMMHKYDTFEYIIMYMNGTIINPETNKPEKFGKFVQKLISLFNKSDLPEEIESNANIKKFLNKLYQFISLVNNKKSKETLRPQNVIETLQFILKNFSERKDWFPKEYLSAFDNTPDQYYAVISRDPQDIGAMSTGQGWSSCQDLDKKMTKGKSTESVQYNEHNWHTLYDVSKGTCVAYLVSAKKWKQSEKDFTKARSDWFKQNKDKSAKEKMYFKNAPIKGATARIAIKPFYGIDKDNQCQLYLSIGTNPKVYGSTTLEKYFVETVNNYLISKQNNTEGQFVIPRELYNESIGNHNIVEVKSGKIIGTSGYNTMLRTKPEKPLGKRLKSYLDKLGDNAWETYLRLDNAKIMPYYLIGEDKDTAIIHNNDISNIDINMKNFYILYSDVVNCNINAKYIGMNQLYETANLDDAVIEYTEYLDTDGKNAYIDGQKLKEFIDMLENTQMKRTTSIRMCDIYCRKMDIDFEKSPILVYSCNFHNTVLRCPSAIMGNIRECVFDNVKINYTENIKNSDKPTNNTYYVCTIEIFDMENKQIQFNGDKFDDGCTFHIRSDKLDISNIVFNNCTINDKVYNGTLADNEIQAQFDINIDSNNYFDSIDSVNSVDLDNLEFFY